MISPLIVKIGAEASGLFATIDKAERKLGTLSSKFEEVGKSAVRLSATAAAVGAAIAVMTTRLAENDDQAGKTAQKIGMTVEAYSSLAYAAKLSNVSSEQLTGGLKQLSKFMVENRIEGVSVEEQLLRIADEFAAAGNDANKTAVAMKYFGKSGAELIPLLNEGRAGIEGMRKEAERLGLVVSKEAAEAAAQFNDNLTRMQALVQGVSRDIAGPLIKSLSDAAAKFLEARTQGEGFWESMKRGIQEFLTGSDLHKWNKDFVRATEALVLAQNQLDRVKNAAASPNGRLFSEQSAAAVAKYTENLKKAQDEVDRLQRIKPVLAPDAPPRPGAPTGSVAVPGDPNAAQRDREFLAKQLQEGLDEEQRIQLEAWAVMAAARDAELEKEKAWRDQRQQIAFAYIDAEQQAEIDKGQAILDADREFKEQQQRLGYKHNQLNLAAAKTFFGSMSALMNTNSEKMFKIGKAAAIAETIINTSAAAMGAYKAMASIPYVGPALGAAAAAAALAAGASQISAIRSQSMSGGGSVGTFPVSPTTGQPVGTPGGDVGSERDAPTKIVHLHGETFGREQLRRLLDEINENTADGGRVVLK